MVFETSIHIARIKGAEETVQWTQGIRNRNNGNCSSYTGELQDPIVKISISVPKYL